VAGIDASVSLENVCYEEFVVCLDARVKIEWIVASEIISGRVWAAALD